jgi:hypothetical protein
MRGSKDFFEIAAAAIKGKGSSVATWNAKALHTVLRSSASESQRPVFIFAALAMAAVCYQCTADIQAPRSV